MEGATLNDITHRAIGAAIEVHRHLGPGLLESVYETCLAHELQCCGLRFSRQHALPVTYKGIALDCGYRIDFLIEDRVILELKSVDSLNEVHKAQLLTYLKLMNLQVGLLINFNVPLLMKGVERVVNDFRG